MLARSHRLTRGDDYRLVVRRGKLCGGGRVVVSCLLTGAERAPRFGFIISKQVGTAVIRNTVRRRLKAVCAQLLDELPPGTDVVIRALPASATTTFTELRSDIVRCIRRVATS